MPAESAGQPRLEHLYKYGFSFIWIGQDVGDTNAFSRMFKHRVVNYCTLDWQALLVDVIIIITLKAFLLLKHI